MDIEFFDDDFFDEDLASLDQSMADANWYDEGYSAYWNGTPLQEQEPLPWQQGWRDAQSDDELVSLEDDYDAN